MSVNDLEKKVENGGATSQGVLSASEYNTLLGAVQEHEKEIETLNAGPEVIGSVSQQVRVEVDYSTRDFIPRSEVKESYALKTDVAKKQNELISGVNIKTINGQSLLDGGNINIGNNGVTDVLKVSLDVSSFAVGGTFSITDAQLNAIIQSRSGYTVVVKDVNNTNYPDNEWGQVIGGYFLNIGGGVTFYRITIMHHTNDPLSTSGDMVMYNIDVTILPGNSNYECKVISVKTL